MVDNIFTQLEAMGRKLWSEGTRLSVFWYFYESTFDRLQNDGSNLPESMQHLRAQVETWKYFWPNEDFLSGIVVDDLGTLPTECGVQNQDTSLTGIEQYPQGLTLIHDAPLFLDEIHQRRHPDGVRSFSAPATCFAQPTASYNLLGSLEPAHPLLIEQLPLQQDTILLASPQLLPTVQQSPQQDGILVNPSLPILADPQSSQEFIVRLPPSIQEPIRPLRDTANFHENIPSAKTIPSPKTIPQLDKLDSGANQNILDESSEISCSKESSLHSTPHSKTPIHQARSNILPNTCGNCNLEGHLLQECIAPVDEFGFISGCPKCNDKSHLFENCATNKNGKKQLLHFLVQKRNRRPPIRWKWDYRDITGFWESDSHPWTWQFSLEKASDNHNISNKGRNRPHDPAWDDPDAITSQAYPGDQRVQDSDQEKESIPMENEDDEEIREWYLSLLPGYKESLDQNSIILCERFNQVINPISEISEDKKTLRARIFRLAVRVGQTVLLEKRQNSSERLTDQQIMKIAKKESREAELETLINAYHEPSKSPQIYTTMEKGKGKEESSLPLATEESFNKTADAGCPSLNPIRYTSLPETMLPPGTVPTPGIIQHPWIMQPQWMMQPQGIMQPQGMMQPTEIMQHPELSQDLQAHHYSFGNLIARSQFGANLTSAQDHRNLNSYSIGLDESKSSSGKRAPICVPQKIRPCSNKSNPNMNALGELLAIPKWHIGESKEQKAIKNKIQKLAKEIKDIDSFVARGELLSNQQLQRAAKKKEKEEELAELSSTYYQPSLPHFGEEPYTSTNVLPTTTSSSCEFPRLSAKSEAAGSSSSSSTTAYARKVGEVLPKLKHIDRRKSQKTASEEESWPSLSDPTKETSPKNIDPGTAKSSSLQSKHAESSPKINVRPWPYLNCAQGTSMSQSPTIATFKPRVSKPLNNTRVKSKDGFATSNEIQPSLVTEDEVVPALTYAQKAASFNKVSQPVTTSKSLKLKNLKTPDAKSQEDFPALSNVQPSPVASISSGTYPSYSQKASSLNKAIQSTTASLKPKELGKTGAEIQDEFPPLNRTQTPPLPTIQWDSPSSYARKASEVDVTKQGVPKKYVSKQDNHRRSLVVSKFSKSITFKNSSIGPKEQQAEASSSETQTSNEESMIAQKGRYQSGSNDVSLSSPEFRFSEVVRHENTGSYKIPQSKRSPSISDPESRSILRSRLQESGSRNTGAYVIPQKPNFLGTQDEESQTSDQTIPNTTSPNPKGKSPGSMGTFFYEGPRSRGYFVSQTPGSGSSVPLPSTQPDIANRPHSPSTSVHANRAREFLSTRRPPGSTRRRCSSLPRDPYLEGVDDTNDTHDTHDTHDTNETQNPTPSRYSNLQQKETRMMRRPEKRRSLSSSETGGPDNLEVLFSGGRIQPLSPSLFKDLRGFEKKNYGTLSSSSVSKTDNSKENIQSPTSEQSNLFLQTQFNTAPPILSSENAIISPEISPLTVSFPNLVVSSSKEPTIGPNLFESPHSDNLLSESARLDDLLPSDAGSDDLATTSLHLSQLKSPDAFELDYSSDGSDEALEAEPDKGKEIPLSSSSDDSVEFILSYEARTERRSRQRTLHHGIRGEREPNRAEYNTVYGPDILSIEGAEGGTAGERAGTIWGHDSNSQIHRPTQTAGTGIRQHNDFEGGLRNMLLRPPQSSTLPASHPTQFQIDRNVGLHNDPAYFRTGSWKCPSDWCGFYSLARNHKCYHCNLSYFNTTITIVFVGDWLCRYNQCSYHNFAKDSRCARCGSPRMRAAAMGTLPLNWSCVAPACGYHNTAARGHCLRCSASCASAIVAYGSEGDWKCISESCGSYNMAENNMCHQCGASSVGAAIVENAGNPSLYPHARAHSHDFPRLHNRMVHHLSPIQYQMFMSPSTVSYQSLGPPHNPVEPQG